MGKVVAMVDDVFFLAKIAETARHTGVELETASTVDALLEKSAANPALIVVDLNARGGAVEALRRLQASGNQTPVVAFLSHVQTALADEARAAGCTEIMPRSKFTQELAAILGRAKT
jgi:DNA-binding NarL/FixJ family response regulator